MRTRATVVVGALVLALTVSGCATAIQPEDAPRRGILLDGPVYDRVSALRGAASAVAVVTVGRVIAQELNDPEKTDGEPALPVSIYQLTIEQAGAGAPAPGTTVDLLYFDTTQVQVDGVSPLVPGQQLVMFLSAHPDGAPGIESVPSFYSAVGQDQGVFDVGPDDRAVARSEEVRSLDGEQAEYDGNHLVTTAGALLATPAARVRSGPR